MTTKIILLILNIAGLLGALFWLYTNPDWEPIVTSIGFMGTLIAQIFSGKEKVASKVQMNQKGGKNSKNYQSKRDININIKNDKR
ncbi:hypothetical protein GC194_12095 [bacterium]|nr:hypothetical protein [bacterium]